MLWVGIGGVGRGTGRGGAGRAVLVVELVGVLLVVKNHKNGYELWNQTVQS